MILIAPDGFKGSCSAREASDAIARGLAHVNDEPTRGLPLSDGGEGFLDVLVAASGARLERFATTNAVGEAIEADVAILDDGRSVAVELSAAAGLAQLQPAQRNPRLTTTYGVGQLIAAVYARYPFERLLLALGGSATVDGGSGLLEALGVGFYDAQDRVLPRGGGALERLARIDRAAAHPVLAGEIVVAVDVDNPLVGPQGAAAIYGPQKGASAADVVVLARGLERLADVLLATCGTRLHDRPGTGSAGGVPAGLLALAGASLTPGFELAARALDLDRAIAESRLVITGEGQLDAQSFSGKVVGRLAKRCAAAGVPLVVLAGNIEPEGERRLAAYGGVAFSIVPGPLSYAASAENAAGLIEAAAARVARLLRAARR